ncbi:MAG: L-histidine N(alpha)-methyltransferase [Congregibacter sp.]
MSAGLNQQLAVEPIEAEMEQGSPGFLPAATAAEVLEGLAQSPKTISPKYFYDQKGSALFDAITRVDDYYLPRIEQQIFEEYRLEMCTAIGAGATLIEPGAGSCEKVKWLLPELQPEVYMPMDISAEHLEESVAALKSIYPELHVTPQVRDHTRDMNIDIDGAAARPVFFYPGSSIGNFDPAAAEDFLRGMLTQLQSQALRGSAPGGLLIGVDAKKESSVLNAAYNDREGLTAEFNVNALSHLNDLLEGNIPVENFEHHAFYNEQEGRIEMHLRCIKSHSAQLAGQHLAFTENELLHTEFSYKYRPEEFIALAARAGFGIKQLWQDSRDWYSFMYFEPASSE